MNQFLHTGLLLICGICPAAAQQVVAEIPLKEPADSLTGLAKLVSQGHHHTWGILNKEMDGAVITFSSRDNSLTHYFSNFYETGTNHSGAAQTVPAAGSTSPGKKAYPINQFMAGKELLTSFWDLKRRFFFTANTGDGSNYRMVDTIEMAGTERVVFAVTQDSGFYILTVDKSRDGGLTLYTKNGLQRHEKVTYTPDFRGSADNGVRWTMEISSKNDLFGAFYDGYRFPVTEIMNSGKQFNYAELQRSFKVYLHNNRLQLLVNHPISRAVLFSFNLADKSLTTSLYDFRSKVLTKDSVFIASGVNLHVRKVLGTDQAEYQAAVFRGNTFITLTSKSNLYVLAYDNEQGRLRQAMVFSADQPANWDKGKMSTVLPGDKTIPAISDFTALLETSVPSVQVQETVSKQVRLQISVADERKAAKASGWRLFIAGLAASFMSPGSAMGMLGYGAGYRAPIDLSTVVRFTVPLDEQTLLPYGGEAGATAAEALFAAKKPFIEAYTKQLQESGHNIRASAYAESNTLYAAVLDLTAQKFMVVKF